ncbi:cytochrome P450 [Trametes elegans]|nr:cytochrome P450 [Trametes elegans]
MSSYLASGAILLLVLIVFASLKWLFSTRASLPPGPSGIPLLGIIPQMSMVHPERKLFEWGEQYGDVMYLEFFTKPTIVLNSLKAATDLLTKRSVHYSDRPRMVLLAELSGHSSSLPPMRYGGRFRKHRRWMHDAVGTKAQIESYRPIQHRELHVLLRNLSADPERFVDHVHMYVGASLLEITYGKRITGAHDPLLEVTDFAVEAVNREGSPLSLIVDFFPILKHIPTWMPGAGFKRRALAVGRAVRVWMDMGYDIVQDAMDAGTAGPSVLRSLIEEANGAPSPEEADDIKGLGCSVFGAGIETTQGILGTFFLAMTRYPYALRAAQDQIDRVIGNGRLLDFADRPLLPYIDAIVEELYRWNPPIPLGIPHRLMVDDEYRGYAIPANCTVISNIWAMSRDTNAYADPEDFRPERHLSARTGALRTDTPLPSGYVFGFGRRVCPGQAFGDAALWLAIANVMAAFDIRCPLDAEGKEVVPLAAFQPGFTSQPEPFSCRISPRSEKYAALIAQLEH